MNTQLRDRVVLPFAIPIGVLALIGGFVFMFSRVLLVVGKEMAVVVALAAAVDILLVCAIIAVRPPTPATNRLAAAVGIGVILAGGFAMRGAGEEEHAVPEAASPVGEVEPAEGPDIRLVAQDLVFDVEQFTLPADQDVTVQLRNEDPATPHNLSAYVDDSLAEPVFRGELFNGVATRDYEFTSPPAGTYFFQCDVHPTTMKGTLTTR